MPYGNHPVKKPALAGLYRSGSIDIGATVLLSLLRVTGLGDK